MLMLRFRACHIYGRFNAKDNRRPVFSPEDALKAPARDYGRIILPPSTYAQEREKIQQRLPAAVRFVADQRMNDIVPRLYANASLTQSPICWTHTSQRQTSH